MLSSAVRRYRYGVKDRLVPDNRVRTFQVYRAQGERLSTMVAVRVGTMVLGMALSMELKTGTQR